MMKTLRKTPISYTLTACFLGLWVAVLGATLAGCGKPGEKPSATADTLALREAETPAPEPVDRYWNDLARYFAGLPPEAGSVLEGLDSLPAAAQHRQYFDNAWGAIEAKLLDPLQDWAPDHLAKAHTATRDVFYPFAGADFMVAGRLYPNARRYLLFGLEMEGPVPDRDWLKNLNRQQVPGDIRNLQRSFDDIMTLSFFKTNDMRGDFVRSQFQGTTPLLMAFIVRNGYQVLEVEPIVLTADGKAVVNETPPKRRNQFSHGDSLVTGTRIWFRHSDRSEKQACIYLQCDASNDGFAKQRGFEPFLRSLQPANGFVKSASYLFQYAYMTKMRDVFLATCEVILQDDTGVMFRDYAPKMWRLQLYGRYVRPIPLFHQRYQADLKQAYASDSTVIRDVPFGMGYTYQPYHFNMLIARKTK